MMVHRSSWNSRRSEREKSVLCLALALSLVAAISFGCASKQHRSCGCEEASSAAQEEPSTNAMAMMSSVASQEELDRIVEEYGVEITMLTVSAGGYMLDFRYKLLDQEKAESLFNAENEPYVIDQKTGARYIVPSPPKVGKMWTKENPIEGRIYYAMFANPGCAIKPGDHVSIVIGDFVAKDLRVQ